MQGYILHCQKVREEDFLVKILTDSEILTLYRFYGARHSVLQMGYKIDFEVQRDSRDIGKLRSPIHLGFVWERDIFIRNFWQHYIKLLYAHLRDIHTVDNFYLTHLDNGSKRLVKENPLRCLLTLYAKLLNFEGRRNDLTHCLLCNKKLNDTLSLVRSIIGVHSKCLSATNTAYWLNVFSTKDIQKWLFEETTEHLEDTTIQSLWDIVLLGF